MNRLKVLGYGLAATIGIAVGARVALPKIYDHKYAEQIDKSKELIKKVSPDTFEKFIKEEKELGIFDSKIRFWYEACKQVDDIITKRCQKVQDSLNIENIIKKAYLDGAQMVRDSIKNAPKIK